MIYQYSALVVVVIAWQWGTPIATDKLATIVLISKLQEWLVVDISHFIIRQVVVVVAGCKHLFQYVHAQCFLIQIVAIAVQLVRSTNVTDTAAAQGAF